MSNPTIRNLYKNFIKFEVWNEEDKQEWDTYEGGFTMGYLHNENLDEKIKEKLFHLLYNEIRSNIGEKKKSLMWVEQVKKISNWKKGETIYGYTREKHYEFNVWFSRNKEDIGLPMFIIEPSGYVSLYCFNNYSHNETEEIKNGFYVRSHSIYNDNVYKIK